MRVLSVRDVIGSYATFPRGLRRLNHPFLLEAGRFFNFAERFTEKVRNIHVNTDRTEIQWLEELALEAHFKPDAVASLRRLSLRQFERMMQSAFGKTPRAWCREVRCRRAVRLALEGLNNKAIVAALHFSSEAQLCHHVKVMYGRSLRATVLAVLSGVIATY